MEIQTLEKLNIDTLDKRQAILIAALELIAEHGFHNSPISAIATRAEVGAGTIYRYFVDKEILIRAVFTHVEGRLHGELLKNYPADQSIRQRIGYYHSGLIRYFIGHPMQFKFLSQFYDSPYGVALRRDKLFARDSQEINPMKALFEQGIAEGLIKDLPIPILFSLFFGSLVAVVRDHILGFVVLDEELIKRIAAAGWDSLKR